MIQYIAAFIGITGAMLLTLGFPWPYLGWLLYAIASSLWVYLGWTSELYGLVIVSTFYAIFETTGFIRHLIIHLKERKARKEIEKTRLY